MLSLYASAFASYASNLIPLTTSKQTDFHIYATAIILLATAINYYSIKVVGKIESYAVIIKLIILLAFVAVGIYGLFGSENVSQLAISNWEAPLHLFAGGMIIFVAYEGFELIANAAPNIKNPRVNIPKAYFYSVGFVICLYIIIAIVTVGSLPFSEIAKAEDYVLAEAAKPLLGKLGFSIITIAALISTFSAINASLYGGSQVSYEIAEDGELPHHFLANLWGKPIGLLITSILTIVLVNSLDLESISTAGSLGFLIVFALVNLANYRLAIKTDSNKYISILGFLISIISVFALIQQQASSNLIGLTLAGSIIGFCFVLEVVNKKVTK